VAQDISTMANKWTVICKDVTYVPGMDYITNGILRSVVKPSDENAYPT